MDLTKLTLLEAKKGLEEKKFSSSELTEEFIKNIKAKKNLNAFITETFDLARERANVSDEKIAKGVAGKLEGLPIAVKDLFCTDGIKTTSASRILENFVPPYESTVTSILDKEGYVMIGKTNMDEFACGSTTKTSYFGATINPYKANNDDRDLVPGGSSGGSAVAVSANMALASTGSDTGGSIRQPASLCGLVGIKPTYGRISRYGMISYASSLDQAGFFTKDIKDSAYLTELVCGKDDKDSTTVDKEVPHFLQNINSNIRGKKVGIIKEFLNVGDKLEKDNQTALNNAIEMFKKCGAEIVEISIPTINLTDLLYMVLSYTELGSNLARFDGVRFGRRTEQEVHSLDELYYKSRSEGFNENVKKRILLGYFLSSSDNYEKYFIKSQKIRRKLTNEFIEAFKKVDVILTPSTVGVAFPIKQTEEEISRNRDSNALNDFFVCPANMVGLPAISVPFATSTTGLPIGMQLIGNYFDEQSIFNFGLFMEENK